MVDTEFSKAMDEIVASLKEAGFDPYEQLCGYIATGKEEYITRTGNAREKIKRLNWLKVKEYVDNMKGAPL